MDKKLAAAAPNHEGTTSPAPAPSSTSNLATKGSSATSSSSLGSLASLAASQKGDAGAVKSPQTPNASGASCPSATWLDFQRRLTEKGVLGQGKAGDPPPLGLRRYKSIGSACAQCDSFKATPPFPLKRSASADAVIGGDATAGKHSLLDTLNLSAASTSKTPSSLAAALAGLRAETDFVMPLPKAAPKTAGRSVSSSSSNSEYSYSDPEDDREGQEDSGSSKASSTCTSIEELVNLLEVASHLSADGISQSVGSQSRSSSISAASRTAQDVSTLGNVNDVIQSDVIPDVPAGQVRLASSAAERPFVNFAPLPYPSYNVPALVDMTPAEKRMVWYDDSDSHRFEADIIDTIRQSRIAQLNNNHRVTNDVDQTCRRGVEHLLSPRQAFERRSRVQGAIRAVLAKQGHMRTLQHGMPRGGNAGGGDYEGGAEPQDDNRVTDEARRRCVDSSALRLTSIRQTAWASEVARAAAAVDEAYVRHEVITNTGSNDGDPWAQSFLEAGVRDVP